MAPRRRRHNDTNSNLLLAGRSLRLVGSGCAQRYAAHLLEDLGARPALETCAPPQPDHPALRWAASGAMWLTGLAQDPPLLAPGPLAEAAEGCRLALLALAPGFGAPGGAPAAAALPQDGAGLLGERAAAFGYGRRGPVSPNGSCHLLATRDGHLALQLARPDDAALLPAWLADVADSGAEHSGADAGASSDAGTATGRSGTTADTRGVAGRSGTSADTRGARQDSAEEQGWPQVQAAAWDFAERSVARADTAVLVERARLVGLPVAPAGPPPARAPAWVALQRHAEAGDPPRGRSPLVLDFSSLWAGPLCASLLAALGARVVKVESWLRPDGARAGPIGFFDLLHAAKRATAFEPRDASGLAALHALVERADIVIEASRPRALQQLGIDAERWLRARPGRVWTGLTGYGRKSPERDWIAFGDDAAVAAGLAVATGSAAAPLFCGDAIADPLAGLHASVATAAAWQAGGGVLIDLSLCSATAHALVCDLGVDVRDGATVESDGCGGFRVEVDGARVSVARPRIRSASGRAPALGEVPIGDATQLDALASAVPAPC